MRAVARGLFLETLPQCPERCGGPGADVARMSEERRRHRARHGCDLPIPEGERAHYAVRCPRCDGAAASGLPCDLCAGPTPGFLHMRRCPASHCTPDISEAMGALTWLREGILPEGSSLGDQSISFVQFRNLFEAEKNEVLAEQKKEG